jgi:hypothetical protein
MISLVEQPFTCVHCDKSFMKEKTLVAHMCERKRRALQRDEKRVQAGYMAFNRFWQLTQRANKIKTYDEFADSSYYNAFVKFGSFLNNVNPLYPEKFVDWVIKSGVKLDHWCRDELYEKYLFETIKSEPVESAVQRSLQTMMEWADENRAVFAHYFNYVSLNRAVHDILNGHISPWIILNTQSGYKMINMMSDEQLNMIAPAFDVPYWQRKFKDQPADVALVKEICKEVGIE